MKAKLWLFVLVLAAMSVAAVGVDATVISYGYGPSYGGGYYGAYGGYGSNYGGAYYGGYGGYNSYYYPSYNRPNYWSYGNSYGNYYGYNYGYNYYSYGGYRPYYFRPYAYSFWPYRYQVYHCSYGWC